MRYEHVMRLKGPNGKEAKCIGQAGLKKKEIID